MLKNCNYFWSVDTSFYMSSSAILHRTVYSLYNSFSSIFSLFPSTMFVSPSQVMSCFKLRTLNCLKGKESKIKPFLQVFWVPLINFWSLNLKKMVWSHWLNFFKLWYTLNTYKPSCSLDLKLANQFCKMSYTSVEYVAVLQFWNCFCYKSQITVQEIYITLRKCYLIIIIILLVFYERQKSKD